MSGQRRHFTRYLYDTIDEAMAQNPAGINSPVFRQPIWPDPPIRPVNGGPCVDCCVKVAVYEVVQLPEYAPQWCWERVS